RAPGERRCARRTACSRRRFGAVSGAGRAAGSSGSCRASDQFVRQARRSTACQPCLIVRRLLTLESTPPFTIDRMHTRLRYVIALSFALSSTLSIAAAQRGAAAMGFDQHKTAHHFFLYETGGAVEVSVNDAAEHAVVDQVRAHLKEIARDFSLGNFDKPFATHGEVPPGVPTMQERRSMLAFRYEEMRNGGRVVITSSDHQAIQAVHAFLRYQIREHATGDSLELRK